MNRPNKDRIPAAASPTRRKFLQGGGMILAGGAIAGGQLGVARGAHAFGSDTIKLGLVGCGARGTSAAIQALNTSGTGPEEGNVQLVSMADVFENNLHASYRSIKGAHPDRVDAHDQRFVGLDAYRKVMQSDADVVILATPPGFRPQHFEAAVAADKHVFMEKPLATDAPGVRRVLAANSIAMDHGLAVQVGLQRRHEPRYTDCISQIQSGAIGDLQFARAYWNGGGVWVRPRTKRQSELEYQLRNWYYFTWLGGDHIVEQHIHNLDVINWLMQCVPLQAQGQGGRERRCGIDHGQIFDHHMVEFTYPGGFKLFSQCRHMQGCWRNVSEHVHGTTGTAEINQSIIRDRDGRKIWKSDAPVLPGKGWQQELRSLFTALRRGETPNECEAAAQSTMTAILGRLATYSGTVVKWNEAFHSDRRLADTDAMLRLDDQAPVLPDASGKYEVAVPGSKTQLT